MFRSEVQITRKKDKELELCAGHLLDHYRKQLYNTDNVMKQLTRLQAEDKNES